MVQFKSKHCRWWIFRLKSLPISSTILLRRARLASTRFMWDQHSDLICAVSAEKVFQEIRSKQIAVVQERSSYYNLVEERSSITMKYTLPQCYNETIASLLFLILFRSIQGVGANVILTQLLPRENNSAVFHSFKSKLLKTRTELCQQIVRWVQKFEQPLTARSWIGRI